MTEELSKYEMKILKKLRIESLPLSILANQNEKYMEKTRLALKRLTADGYIEVGSKYKKTYYSLSKKGINVIKKEEEKIREIVGKYYNTTFYINGIEFESKNTLENYIMSFVSEYKVGDYLSTEHQKIVTDCMRMSDWCIELIPDIYKIKVLVNDHADVLSIVTNNLSEKAIRVHDILQDKKQIHKNDIKHAFRYALHTDSEDEDIKYYNNSGFTLLQLVDKFLKTKKMNFDDVNIERIDSHLTIMNDGLKDDWVTYYRENVDVIRLTQDEIDLLVAKKNMVQKNVIRF